MRLTGALLLIAGWLLVLCALIMLGAGPARNAFVIAGMGVEILGFTLAIRSHLPVRPAR